MKLGVRLDQPLYLGSRAGLGMAEGYFTNDLVTLIAPCPSVAADWEKQQQQSHFQPKIYLVPTLSGGSIFAQDEAI